MCRGCQAPALKKKVSKQEGPVRGRRQGLEDCQAEAALAREQDKVHNSKQEHGYPFWKQKLVPKSRGKIDPCPQCLSVTCSALVFFKACVMCIIYSFICSSSAFLHQNVNSVKTETMLITAVCLTPQTRSGR